MPPLMDDHKLSRHDGASNGHVVTVAALAKAKRLPVSFLTGLGVENYSGGVYIPYCDFNGDLLRKRKRFHLVAKKGSCWCPGQRTFAYGSDHIELGRKAAFLVIVEGETDCWALWHHGMPALGLPGSGMADRILQEHLISIEKVYVSHEPGDAGDGFVNKVSEQLRSLRFRGSIFDLRMPDGLKDPCDLHVDDPERFLQRFSQARKKAQELLDPVPEAADDPHRLARLFGDAHRVAGDCTLRFWRQQWYRWDGAAYRNLPADELHSELTQFAKREFDHSYRVEAAEAAKSAKGQPKPTVRKVTKRLVADVENALKGAAMLSSALEAPAWIDQDRSGLAPASEMMICSNTLLHLPSWAHGKESTFKLTPNLFTTNALDYAFQGSAPKPKLWLEFLTKVWPKKDPEEINVLQRWFGYCLLPDTSLQKILMIMGPTRSGKGTIARILRAMIGVINTASPSLASLGTNFGLQPLLGKTLAVISDARLSPRTDEAMVVERLLSISGEDAQTIDRKNQTQVTAKLPVRFMILTNELPRLHDPSGAFVARLVILRQTKSWLGKEDKELTAKLLTELPGILNWSLEGYRLLQKEGRFTQPKASKRIVEQMEDLGSNIGAFVRECCEVGEVKDFKVRSADLYECWKKWCERVGKKPGSEFLFGRDLRAAVSTLEDSRPREGTLRPLTYHGIRIQQGTPFD